MSAWKLSLFASFMTVAVALPAAAQMPEDTLPPATVVVPAAAPPVEYKPLTPEERAEVIKRAEKRTKIRRERKARKPRADKFKNMTQEERDTAQQAIIEWFKALPIEKQDMIMRRHGGKIDQKPEAKAEESAAPVAPVAQEQAPPAAGTEPAVMPAPTPGDSTTATPAPIAPGEPMPMPAPGDGTVATPMPMPTDPMPSPMPMPAPGDSTVPAPGTP